MLQSPIQPQSVITEHAITISRWFSGLYISLVDGDVLVSSLFHPRIYLLSSLSLFVSVGCSHGLPLFFFENNDTPPVSAQRACDPHDVPAPLGLSSLFLPLTMWNHISALMITSGVIRNAILPPPSAPNQLPLQLWCLQHLCVCLQAHVGSEVQPGGCSSLTIL